MGGGKGDVRLQAEKGPSHDSTRGPESSRRPRGEKGGGGEKGAVAMATPPIRPDFQRGRKNFKSQPSALEQLLLKGVHTAPPPSVRGQSWVPPPLGRRPRRPSPPSRPTRDPRPASARRVAPVLVSRNSAASTRLAPGGEKGVCVRLAGARTSPPSSRRLPSARAPTHRAAASLPTGWTAGAEGAPRSFGESASERLPQGLGERVQTNSS